MKTFNSAFDAAIDQILEGLTPRQRGRVRFALWFRKRRMRSDAFDTCKTEMPVFGSANPTMHGELSADIWTDLLALLIPLLLEWLENLFD